MGTLSSNNRAAQPGGTATTVAAAVDVTAKGNGRSPPRQLALQNIGPATLYYSTTDGVAYNSIPPGGSFTWPEATRGEGNCGIYEVLVKTLAGTAVYQFEAGY